MNTPTLPEADLSKKLLEALRQQREAGPFGAHRFPLPPETLEGGKQVRPGLKTLNLILFSDVSAAEPLVIFSPLDRGTLLALQAQYDQAMKQAENYSSDKANEKYSTQQTRMSALLIAGENLPEEHTFLAHEDLAREFRERQKAFHTKLEDITAKAVAIIRPAVARVEKVLADALIALEVSDRWAAAECWDMPYHPSQIWKCCASMLAMLDANRITPKAGFKSPMQMAAEIGVDMYRDENPAKWLSEEPFQFTFRLLQSLDGQECPEAFLALHDLSQRQLEAFVQANAPAPVVSPEELERRTRAEQASAERQAELNRIADNNEAARKERQATQQAAADEHVRQSKLDQAARLRPIGQAIKEALTPPPTETH